VEEYPGYPKLFNCPRCGSSKRIVESEVEEAKRSGQIRQDAIAGLRVDVSLLCDPTTTVVLGLIPALQVVRDVCAKCGTEYVYRVDKKRLPLQMAVKQRGSERWPRM